MKVWQLIEKLKVIDLDLEVLLPGYEGGLTDLNEVTVHDVVLNTTDCWYYGPHDYYGQQEHTTKTPIKAVVIDN